MFDPISPSVAALVSQDRDMWEALADAANANPSAVSELLGVDVSQAADFYERIMKAVRYSEQTTQQEKQKKVVKTGDRSMSEGRKFKLTTYREFAGEPTPAPALPGAAPAAGAPAPAAQPAAAPAAQAAPEMDMQNRRLDTLYGLYMPKVLDAVRNPRDAAQLMARLQHDIGDLKNMPDAAMRRMDMTRTGDLGKRFGMPGVAQQPNSPQ